MFRDDLCRGSATRIPSLGISPVSDNRRKVHDSLYSDCPVVNGMKDDSIIMEGGGMSQEG